jgi:hypothetical protein
MPGSFDLSPVPGGQAVQALPIVVCLYQPGGENPYTILPNVFCLRIDYREGPEPPLARFQYMMGDLLEAALGWPSQFEQLWPIDAQGNYVVLTDDRLVVLTQLPPATADANPQTIVLFDGFAQVPQADVSAGSQAVTFVAQGVAIRLWDSPITGRVQRDASKTSTTDGSADVLVQLPCRFNPADNSVAELGGYIGNCVPSGELTTNADETYPVFLDPLVVERGDWGVDTSYWYVSDALTYLIINEPSPEDNGGSPYVLYPPTDTLASILSCEAPPDNGILNIGDAVSSDIQIRDYDASNKAVPDVMAELLRYCGFVMVYYTDTYTDGTPETSLKIVRRDGLATAAPKLFYLAASGSTSLNLGSNNATALHLARDCNALVNQWTVETALKQVEVTVYLAPGFQPAAGDENAASVQNFLSSRLTNATSHQRRMYRWFIADECGDGHWNMETSTWVTGKPIDFSAVFPPDMDGNATYVDRYRPGSRTLISKDAAGKPLKAVLEFAPGYYSGDPDLETDPDQGGWLTISKGWQLLDDRLGIEVSIENPEQWGSGNPKLNDIRTITWTAAPTQPTAFLLRLTTVIEADQRIPAKDVTAAARTASPTLFDRERSADGKDHFQYCSVAPNSLYYAQNGGDGTNPVVVRDDTKAALPHTEQLRSAHEFPTLAGSATVPFLTDYYQIGDRVKIVQGRNASLQINVGVDQGEAPSYPWITAFAWDFTGDKQQTVLQFSDRRAEPQSV